MQVSLRPVQDDDTEFLYEVYASTREEELLQTDWSPEQKNAFTLQQFNAQSSHYRKHYPNAQYFVIQSKEKPIGRLYLDYWTKEIRIMDIALLPAYRGKGIGVGILKNLMAEAKDKHLKLSIHVEMFNRALHLYKRLGFQEVSMNGVYYLMEWQASNDEENSHYD